MIGFRETAIHWSKYFELTKDRTTKVWLLSDEPSSVMSSTKDFNVGSTAISIIDHFNGRLPYLLNYKFLVKHEQINIKFIPTIILDSNLINLLKGYINSPNTTNEQSRCTYQFLKFVVERNFDYNLVFYFLESAVMNGIEKAINNGNAAAATILQLHTMNEKIFLQDGSIIPDRKRVKEYAKRYGINSIDSNFFNDIATLMAKEMLKDVDEQFIDNLRYIINYTYAALLKLVLINTSNKQNIANKLQEFCDFFECQLNLVLGRELAIATYYLSNKLQSKFIPFEIKQIPFATVRARLCHTARDFFLLRVPEISLSSGNEQKTLLCFVCSAEKAIRQIGRLITIESLVSSPKLAIPSGISFNQEELQQKLSEDAFDVLCKQQQQQVAARLIASTVEKREPISKEQLKDLITNLEDQIKTLCKQ